MCFLDDSLSDWSEMASQGSFDLHSMMAKDVEHFTKKYLLAIYTSSFAKNVSLVHLSIY